ncbi:MAG: glycosyltransferase, partial [Ferruginibacter sp.]
VIISPQKGRAAQMNFGASMATSDILYFIHADTLPPPSFFTDINQALKEGFELGRYRTRFQSKNRILQFNAFFTRFDLLVCYGGDQTFFITKKLFKSVGGFNADMQLMEDYDIVTRARALARYKIFQKDAKVSARKYENNTWLQVQRANFIIVQMYKKGASQESLAEKYRRLLTYRKG